MRLLCDEVAGRLRSGAAGLRPLYRVHLPGFRHPVYYRRGGSDLDVLSESYSGAFGYDAVGIEPGVEYIFDCGGNIGLASFYFLHRYPAARVVLFEPDGDNLRVARKTLAPFAGQVTFVQAGVWSASVGLVVERGRFRDGQEWSFQVREARPAETPDLQAVTLDEALAASGFPRLDLVKIDIEAAEREVFARGPLGWLDRTRVVVVEIHDEACAAAVNAALLPRNPRVAAAGELTIYRFA